MGAGNGISREALVFHIIRLGHTYSFLSGVGISLATNILVSLAVSRDATPRGLLLAASVLMLLSGCLYQWLRHMSSAHRSHLLTGQVDAMGFLKMHRVNSPGAYRSMERTLLVSFATAGLALLAGLGLFLSSFWP